MRVKRERHHQKVTPDAVRNTLLFAPQLGQKRVEGAFLGRERGGGELGEDVGHVDAGAFDHPEDREFQKPLAETAKSFFVGHKQLPCGIKVDGHGKVVK